MAWLIIYKCKFFVKFSPFGKITFKSQESAKNYIKKRLQRNTNLNINAVKRGDLVVFTKGRGTPGIVKKVYPDKIDYLVDFRTTLVNKSPKDIFNRLFTTDLSKMEGKFVVVSNEPYLKKRNDFE